VARLKACRDSDDVVLARSDRTVLVQVKDSDRARFHKITDFLKAQEWTGVHPGRRGAPPTEGAAQGTFSTQLIHLDHRSRQ
jgi:hypothetical protein